MAEENGFTTVSISTPLINKIDKIYKKKHFSTRAGYIHFILRKAIEEDDK
jgi:metal-responsive CopG/Arc/MetJ family transcriptional regulator